MGAGKDRGKGREGGREGEWEWPSALASIMIRQENLVRS